MYIKPLDQVSKADIGLVGGKAASLGEMLQAGLLVPPGFAITTEAFRAGMSKQLKQEILQAFDDLGFERVAVRSSAVAEDSGGASWAGQLESYLNTTRKDVIKAVEDCWDSIDSERATEYAKDQGLSEEQRAVGVVVQGMVDSEISGVTFTANPINQDRGQCVIEAVYGLGEMIVQGMVTPETIIIYKAGKLLERSQHRQRRMLVYREGENQEIDIPTDKNEGLILSDKQIAELLDTAKKIEDHYGTPQDIEWAIADDKLYIVQSRPITTLSEVGESENGTVFGFEKTFVREESLILVQILGQEVAKWLTTITTQAIPSMFCRLENGLTETWLCNEATEMFINDVFEHNIKDEHYLERNIREYKKVVAQLAEYEQRQHARSLDELKTYLDIFRKAMIPIHVIFFTPFREDTPKHLFDLAVKARGEDALFDNGDLYVRDSLIHLYPDLNGIETFLDLADLEHIDIGELRTRENNFIWLDEKHYKMSLDEFRSAHPNYYVEVANVDHSQKSFTGTVAYKGIVQGKAQVVLRKRDVASFDADILVAPMTTPHYLPAMRKAKAFVTDEGGVTCHAAIVAREMKKPCIIGTQVATQVLQTGDLTEVDGQKGIVTILN